MALFDLVLKARVNMAQIRDPRVSSQDIGVRVQNGCVTLSGDVDREEEIHAAVEIARAVPGVTKVESEMTCGLCRKADTAELLTLRLLERLDDAWHELPDENALTQGDYLRWALWLVHKFHIPETIADGGNRTQLEAEAQERALARIADYVGAPKALVAMEMLRQAEEIAGPAHLPAPEIANAPLIATPARNDAALRAN